MTSILNSLLNSVANFLNTLIGGAPSPSNGHSAHYAPEIDPTVAVSAIAILAGGILLIGDRVRKIRRSREG